MPKEITRTYLLYSFQELLDLENNSEFKKGCEKARQWLIEGVSTYDWRQDNFKTWKDTLDQIGFINATISFHGFSSQGDGASFTSGVDIERLVSFFTTSVEVKDSIVYVPDNGKVFRHSEDFRPWLIHKLGGKITEPKYRFINWMSSYISAIVIRTNHHYVHWNTCRFNWDCEIKEGSRFGNLIDAFTIDCECLCEDICMAIYADLQKEYEYRTADKQLAEDSYWNEWMFTKQGDREWKH